jgi:hypothetical protein
MAVSRETGRSIKRDPIAQDLLAVQIDLRRQGKRKTVQHGGTLCSGCYDEPPLPNNRYGKKCHAKHQNEWQRKKRADEKAKRTSKNG